MFDELLKNTGLGNHAGQLVGMIAQHLQSKGGVQGLMQHMQANGMVDQVQSWVSTGENQPINAEQAKSALGGDFLQDLAGKLGVEESQVTQAASQVLPGLVDKATPNGQAEEGHDLMGTVQGLLGGNMPDLGGMIGGMFGNKS